MIDEGVFLFPDRFVFALPSDLGLDFEDVYFQTEDGVLLSGWFVPGQIDVTWLWFHGNAGNISYRLDNLALLHHRLAVNIFIFDYRGFGKSQGRACGERLFLDADASLSYLLSRPDVDPGKIVFFGRSLGSAVAVELATRQKCLGLILESPFALPAEMMETFPLFQTIVFRTKYDTLSKIKSITVPLLILHGDRDEVVPFEMGKLLYEAANEPKRFHTIRGASHNDTYIVGGEEYFAALKNFIESLTTM